MPSLVRRSLFAVLVAALFIGGADAAPPPLRWGGDAEGGAPFVEADPNDPTRVRGFDVDVAGELAKGLGREPQFVQVAFTSIDQSVARGDFEIGMSGVEDTPARRAALAATIAYFEFREVITVREADRDRFRSLAALKGRRVGTLGGTIAYEILLDNIIAARSVRRVGGLVTQPDAVAVGHYVAVLAKENGALRDQVNAILRARMADGTLERI